MRGLEAHWASHLASMCRADCAGQLVQRHAVVRQFDAQPVRGFGMACGELRIARNDDLLRVVGRRVASKVFMCFSALFSLERFRVQQPMCRPYAWFRKRLLHACTHS